MESHSKDDTFLITKIRLTRFAVGELSKVQILNVSGQPFMQILWFTYLDSRCYFLYRIYFKREQIIMNNETISHQLYLMNQRELMDLGVLT